MKKYIGSAMMLMMMCNGAYSQQGGSAASYTGFKIPNTMPHTQLPSAQQFSQVTSVEAFKKGPFANILKMREETLTKLTTLINQRIHQIQGMASDYMNLQQIIINQKHGGIGPRKNRFALTDKIQALQNDIVQSRSKQHLQPEPAIGFTDPHQVVQLNEVGQQISSLIDMLNSYTYDLNSIIQYYQTLYQTEKLNPNHQQAIADILNKVGGARQQAAESLVDRVRGDNKSQQEAAALAKKSGLVR